MARSAEATLAPDPMVDAAIRPMRKDAARNRELLIASARVVFAQRGLEASLDDVARHAGLGVGTAYRHFANKRELASALIMQAIDEIVERAELAAANDDPWQGLVSFLEGALELQATDRGLREVLTGAHDPEQLDGIHERLAGLLTQILDRGIQAGVIRADAEFTDIGFVMAMLCSVVDIAGDEAPELWRRYLALCLDGLKPGASPLPVAALSEPDFLRALSTHKQALSGSS